MGIQDVPVRVPIRLGQFLKLAGLVDSGAEASDLIAGQDVEVDDSGITQRTLLTRARTDWDDVTRVRMSNPAMRWGPVLASLAGWRNRVRVEVLGGRRTAVTVVPQSQVGELAAVLEQYGHRLELH